MGQAQSDARLSREEEAKMMEAITAGDAEGARDMMEVRCGGAPFVFVCACCPDRYQALRGVTGSVALSAHICGGSGGANCCASTRWLFAAHL